MGVIILVGVLSSCGGDSSTDQPTGRPTGNAATSLSVIPRESSVTMKWENPKFEAAKIDHYTISYAEIVEPSTRPAVAATKLLWRDNLVADDEEGMVSVVVTEADLDTGSSLQAGEDASYTLESLNTDTTYMLMVDVVYADNQQVMIAMAEMTTGPNNDEDSMIDAHDPDDDNDNIMDEEDNCVFVSNTDQQNSDTDSLGDECDSDDDNDQVMDVAEVEGCERLADCDGDQVMDNEDNCVLVSNSGQQNYDNDAQGDSCDEDDDNDLRPDAEEAPDCIYNDDCDNDGIIDGMEEAGCAMTADCDGDQVSDGDEVAGCVLLADCDRDQVNDNIDNCVLVGNSGQDDQDGDGIGDACDADRDGDSLIEIASVQVLRTVEVRQDSYRNQVGCPTPLGCQGYELVADLVLDEDGPINWSPIGSTSVPFSGTFDGNNHTIHNLLINRPGDDRLGLFGRVEPGTRLENLRLRNVSVIGRHYVGGLVGYGSGAHIHNIELSDVTVRGSNFAGGLVGSGNHADIHGAVIRGGSVTGNSYTGGLVGIASYTKAIDTRIQLDLVNGTNSVGGVFGFSFAGRLEQVRADIDSVVGRTGYSTGGFIGYGLRAEVVRTKGYIGEVRGRNHVGGLSGYGEHSSNQFIDVTLGSIDCVTNCGGLIGQAKKSQIYYANVHAERIHATGRYIGGLIGTGLYSKIFYSAVRVADLQGDSHVGGIIGSGGSARLLSSSAETNLLQGRFFVGGLAGYLPGGLIIASYALGSRSNADHSLGALIGEGRGTAVYFSYAAGIEPIPTAQDELFDDYAIGGDSVVASYLVADEEDSQLAKPMDALQAVTNYSGIYVEWDDGIAVEPGSLSNRTDSESDLTIWCDEDLSFNIEESEKVDENRLWYFGSGGDYPVLTCIPDRFYYFSLVPHSQAVEIEWRNPDRGDDLNLTSIELMYGAARDNNMSLAREVLDEEFYREGSHTYQLSSLMDEEYYVIQLTASYSDGSRQSLGQGSVYIGFNTDGDTLADSIDYDDDNDGYNDDIDVFPTDSSEWLDGDRDGVGNNADNCPTIRNSDQLDLDNDGTGDLCDRDYDGDGVANVDELIGCSLIADCDYDGYNDGIDAFPRDRNEWLDTDSDSIGDNSDNCPTVANADQLDQDGDDWGDVCDRDKDNNGLIEIAVASQLRAVGEANMSRATINLDSCPVGDDLTRQCNGYELTDDIDLSAETAWQPLGNQDQPFPFIFEGNDHAITNLVVAAAEQDFVGLFGSLADQSQVRNLYMHDIEVVGRDFVGGLVGRANDEVKFDNVHIENMEISGRNQVGGLVGQLDGGSVMDSTIRHSIINASGSNVGGLVGRSEDGVRYYALASDEIQVLGANEVGGIIGTMMRGHIAVAGSRHSNITAVSSHAGGLIGFGQGNYIVSSYAQHVRVQAGVSEAGGLVGMDVAGRIVTSYVRDSYVHADSGSGGLVGFMKATYSYFSYVADVLVEGTSNTGALVGSINPQPPSVFDATYQNMNTSDSDTYQSSAGLQQTTDYSGIYAGWGEPIAASGQSPWDLGLSQWCDTNRNRIIDPSEQHDDNRVWDFGSQDQYPALRCVVGGLAEQR